MPDIFTPKKEEPVQKPIQEQPAPAYQPAQETPPVQQRVTPQKTQTQPIGSEPPEKVTVAQTEISGKHPAKEVLQAAKNTVQLFSHYCEHPQGVQFINQEDGEDILLFLRRHFATNIPWIITTVLLLFMPLIVYALFTLSNFTLFSIPATLIFVLIGFYYLVVFNYALLNFINWFYDMGIVSEKRLIDLDANNILHHHWAETEIADVVDVSVTQQGFFQSFFDYGNVHIQTEAIKANFEFVAAPKPSTVSDIIGDLKALISRGASKE